jgi:pimeloyl-ACP methyl ester carboxylesterase
MSNTTTTFASFDGTTIAYQDVGAGPAVVLVHGFIGNQHMMWNLTGYVDALVGAGRRVVTLDLRGHGRSAKPHDLAAYENRALARDVVALADARGLESYDLIGYSLGAIVAGSVAQLDQRVRSLLLGGMGHLVMDPDWDRPRQLVASLSGAGAADEPAAVMMVNAIESLGGDRLAMAGVQHGHVPLPADDLATLRVPTLVLCGVDDDMNGDAAGLHAAIPGARLVITPGDHTGAFATDEYRHEVFAWLDEVSPTGGKA